MFPRPLAAGTDRERAATTRFTFLLHLRPVLLPARTLPWTHTFGLGGSTLVLVAVLAATGILMMLVYQPVPGVAYDSVVTLEGRVAFGPLVRGVHWWSANLLVVVVLLHTARVFLTGGYHGPRQFNWVIGSLLLLCLLANNFTGYLMPWDQLAYWAVTISTGMLGYVPWIGGALQRIVRGGPEIGPETLVNFYTIHTTIVPVLLVLLMGFHFWRVRRAGGVVVPPMRFDEIEEQTEKVHFLPHLLFREVAQALVIVAVVVVLAALFGAPLGERANPGMSPNPAKAPWYFVGFQELLIHLHPFFALLVIPATAALLFVLLPYLTSDDEPSGAWFLSERGRTTAVLAAGIGLLTTPVLVVLDEIVGSGAEGWFTGGLLPTAALVAAIMVFGAALRRRFETTTNETVQAVAVLLAAAFAVLTLIGVWFRGEGMALVWPWQL
jgi:quinol-cytochrome oxidoreductase complex cytochrome b subunit